MHPAPENQLKAIDLDNDSTEDIEFGYDFSGQRLWRKKNGVLTGIWIGGVYEYKDTDADGISIALCHVHSEVGLIASFEPNPTQDSVFYYYHSDHLGSSSVVTNREGDIQKHYGYSVFGDERYDDADYSANIAPSSRYTGQVLDEDTGLYYYNARYYDPLLGRFIQPDTVLPSLSSQGLNRYSYVNNNPLKFTDPSGHASIFVAANIANAYYSCYSAMSTYGGGNSFTFSSDYSSRSYSFTSSSYSGAGALSSYVVGSTSGVGSPGQLNDPGYSYGMTTMAFPSVAAFNILSEIFLMAVDKVTNNGRYVGTGYGEQAVDFYVDKVVSGDDTGCQQAVWYVGGCLASLWTPETYQTTAIALGGAYIGAQGAGAKTKISSIAARQEMVAARTAEQIALRSQTATVLHQARASGMTPQLLKQLRVLGSELGWAEEAQLVRMTGQGTRAWSTAEISELLQNGKVAGYSPHHINSVSQFKWMAGNANNIRIVERWTEHGMIHGWNTQRPTMGPLRNRSEMIINGLLEK